MLRKVVAKNKEVAAAKNKAGRKSQKKPPPPPPPKAGPLLPPGEEPPSPLPGEPAVEYAAGLNASIIAAAGGSDVAAVHDLHNTLQSSSAQPHSPTEDEMAVSGTNHGTSQAANLSATLEEGPLPGGASSSVADRLGGIGARPHHGQHHGGHHHHGQHHGGGHHGHQSLQDASNAAELSRSRTQHREIYEDLVARKHATNRNGGLPFPGRRPFPLSLSPTRLGDSRFRTLSQRRTTFYERMHVEQRRKEARRELSLERAKEIEERSLYHSPRKTARETEAIHARLYEEALSERSQLKNFLLQKTEDRFLGKRGQSERKRKEWGEWYLKKNWPAYYEQKRRGRSLTPAGSSVSPERGGVVDGAEKPVPKPLHEGRPFWDRVLLDIGDRGLKRGEERSAAADKPKESREAFQTRLHEQNAGFLRKGGRGDEVPRDGLIRRPEEVRRWVTHQHSQRAEWLR